VPEYKRPDYSNPRLAACARKLDASLMPVIDDILASRGMTRADLPTLVAQFQAQRQAEHEARQRGSLADDAPSPDERS
jgi:IMP cyclohydrolase